MRNRPTPSNRSRIQQAAARFGFIPVVAFRNKLGCSKERSIGHHTRRKHRQRITEARCQCVAMTILELDSPFHRLIRACETQTAKFSLLLPLGRDRLPGF